MDIISFNEAATANSRIEICNANPDSTSGIITIPKVIASGETITIPAGRVAILPNVQIDGVLNIENDGEVFIPSGATLSTVVEKVTSTDNAIVRFDGTTGKVQNSAVTVNDNGTITTQGLMSTSPIYGIGYGTGAGGTVTQLTSKSTAVTLNKPCGKITMNGASLAADGVVQFAVNTSAVSSNDIVYATISSGVSSNFNYIIQTQGVYVGGFGMVVRNASGISLSENIVINFAIIKGAIS